MTLTIQDLGALGELLGSVAVLATLVSLALQMRQNTLAIGASEAGRPVDRIAERAVVPQPDRAALGVVHGVTRKVRSLSACTIMTRARFLRQR